jgi:hypothetical protein
MVKLSKRKRSGNSQAGPRKKARNGRKRRPAGESAHSAAIRQVARMISDPCHGPLVNYSIDNGVVERVRGGVGIMPGGSGTDQGYVIVFPSYSSHEATAVAGYSYNMMVYNPASTTLVGLNTTATPLGTSTSLSGYARIDPAASALSGTTFASAKTLAACLTARYTGTEDAKAGEWAMISNFNVNDMFATVDTGLPSVSEIFAFAGTTIRVADSADLIWRPTAAASKQRSPPNIVHGLPNALQEVDDTVWTLGTATVAPSRLTCADPENCNGIVFAWRGISSANFVLDYTKIVEFKVRSTSGFIERAPAPPPSRNSVRAASLSSTIVTTATAALDKHSPGWQTFLGRGIESGLAWLGNKAEGLLEDGISAVVDSFSFLGF